MKISGVECNEHGVPIGGFKVGDKVDWWDWQGIVESAQNTPNDGAAVVVTAEAGGRLNVFYADGRFLKQQRPSLRLVERPSQKAAGWAVVSKDGRIKAAGFSTRWYAEAYLMQKWPGANYAEAGDRIAYVTETDPPEGTP